MLETDYKFGEVHCLAEQIEAGTERVNFKTVFSNKHGGVALIAFKAGQKLDEHVAPAELMVTALDGEIEFNINGKPNILHAGDFLLVGENVTHSVVAKTDSKMMLVKIKA